MELPNRPRVPLLWWVAGADSDVLAKCPRGDQIFVQHLGISLIAAFLFVFLISTVSMLVAFPDIWNDPKQLILAPGFGFLIAAMVFLIDRLFIQYDWDWQAAEQKRALARAAWERAPLEQQLASKQFESGWSAGARRIRRYIFLWARVLLSAAIGLTIASFLELVIYKDEIKTNIQKIHYAENKLVYDEINTRAAQLDEEIVKAKNERDRLLSAKGEAEAQLNKLELAPPPLLSDENVSQIEKQITELRSKIAEEEANVRRYNQDMIAEARGTLINPGNSGLQGMGPRYLTAADLKALSETAIASYRTKIASLEADKRKALVNKDNEYDAAKKKTDDQINGLRKHIIDIAAGLTQAQNYLFRLSSEREPAIEKFSESLKSKPNFIPISFGVASQFRALRALYNSYGSTFEMIMIKLLIMMLEMTPVLQKVLLSPTTLYAVRLDAIKRTSAYEHFNEELRLRQEHLRRKADAVMDEELDGKGIEKIRQGNVTPLHEGRGAS